MRKFLLIAFIAVLSVNLQAQTCDTYFFLQNGKTVEMTLTNKKGKVTGINTYKVTEVNNAGGTHTGKIEMVMVNDKAKEMARANSRVKCSGNSFQVEMTSFIPGPQMEQLKNIEADAEFYLDYPAGMKTGDALQDSEMQIETTTNGMKTSTELSITNRVVTGKESLTTTAGTWECFTITSNQKIRMRIAGIGIPMNFDVTEWYAPGFGIVQSESKHGKTQITAIK